MNNYTGKDTQYHYLQRNANQNHGCHFTPTRMAIIKKLYSYMCWWGRGEISILTWLMECKMVQPLWKMLWRFLKKLNRATAWPSNSIPSYGLRIIGNRYQIFVQHINVHSSIIHNIQKMETQAPINRWVDKQNVLYPHNGILFSHKKKWNADTCYNMDQPWKSTWKKPAT